MAETICKGYLVYRQDYNYFDEIIGFINEYGNLFFNIALGTKKILSKNARNLFYGCLSEFEFFASKNIDFKMGRLKKVTLLENNIAIAYRMPLLVTNMIVAKNKLKGIKVFNLIKQTIDNLLQFSIEYDAVLIIDCLIRLCPQLGIKLQLNHCSMCNSKLIYSFSPDSFGFVCEDHWSQNYKIDPKAIELLYCIFLKKYQIANRYDSTTKKVVTRILVDFINDNAGFNLYNFLFK